MIGKPAGPTCKCSTFHQPGSKRLPAEIAPQRVGQRNLQGLGGQRRVIDLHLRGLDDSADAE